MGIRCVIEAEPGLDPGPPSAAFQHIVPVRLGLLTLTMAPGNHCGQGLCEKLATPQTTPFWLHYGREFKTGVMFCLGWKLPFKQGVSWETTRNTCRFEWHSIGTLWEALWRDFSFSFLGSYRAVLSLIHVGEFKDCFLL